MLAVSNEQPCTSGNGGCVVGGGAGELLGGDTGVGVPTVAAVELVVGLPVGLVVAEFPGGLPWPADPGGELPPRVEALDAAGGLPDPETPG